MSDSLNSSSFIPKRAATARTRQSRTHNFFILSIISYACLVAAPTASAAVYVYKIYTEKQFEQSVNSLDESINSFKESDLSKVIEFDKRIKAAKKLVDSHVSVLKTITALEAITTENVGFNNLSITRQGSGDIRAEASVVTTDFDTAIFQRSIYSKENKSLSKALLSGITFVPAGDSNTEKIDMKAVFDFPASAILFTGDDDATTVVDIKTSQATTTDSTSSEFKVATPATDEGEESSDANENNI
jgi:hypothetical protein